MNKSVLQIANDIVEACPYTAKMKSAYKILLAGILAEELSRQRREGYAAGYSCGINSEYYGQNTRHRGT